MSEEKKPQREMTLDEKKKQLEDLRRREQALQDEILKDTVSEVDKARQEEFDKMVKNSEAMAEAIQKKITELMGTVNQDVQVLKESVNNEVVVKLAANNKEIASISEKVTSLETCVKQINDQHAAMGRILSKKS